jgi:hypothetical protein
MHKMQHIGALAGLAAETLTKQLDIKLLVVNHTDTDAHAAAIVLAA